MGTGMASVVFIKPVWSHGLRAGASGSFRGVFPASATCMHVGDFIAVAAAPELLAVPRALGRGSPVLSGPAASKAGRSPGTQL